jgi:hypothetical protein
MTAVSGREPVALNRLGTHVPRKASHRFHDFVPRLEQDVAGIGLRPERFHANHTGDKPQAHHRIQSTAQRERGYIDLPQFSPPIYWSSQSPVN